MTTMIERVARAIAPEAFHRRDVAKEFVERAGRTWEGSYEFNVHALKLAEVYVKARAAIEAMRAPQEAIIWAGASELETSTSFVDAQDVWHTMIDAALKESK